MKVTHEEIKAAKVPLNFRDYCAHILIPLNKCRVSHWYSPFQCTDLRHAYEKCQYDECAPSAARAVLARPTRARTTLSLRRPLPLPARVRRPTVCDRRGGLPPAVRPCASQVPATGEDRRGGPQEGQRVSGTSRRLPTGCRRGWRASRSDQIDYGAVCDVGRPSSRLRWRAASHPYYYAAPSSVRRGACPPVISREVVSRPQTSVVRAARCAMGARGSSALLAATQPRGGRLYFSCGSYASDCRVGVLDPRTRIRAPGPARLDSSPVVVRSRVSARGEPAHVVS